MSQFQKFARNVGLMGITHFILGLQAFLLLPILTKFLGATDFGIWSQIKITVTLLGGLAALGLDTTIIIFLSGEKNKKKISEEFILFLMIALGAATFLGGMVFIFSKKIGLTLTHLNSAGFFFKFILVMLLLWVTHFLLITFFRAKENIKFYSLIEIIRVTVEIGLVYFLLIKGYGLIGVILSFILVESMLILVSLINIKKYILLVKPSFKTIKPYLSFSLPLIIMPVLSFLLQTGDQYIVGYYNGAKAVGVYALAYSLCVIIKILVDPIYLILQPVMSKYWNLGDQEKVRLYFTYSYKYAFMMVIPTLFGLSLLAEPILKIISTAEFVEAKILVPIIALGIALYTFFFLAMILLQLVKKTRKITKIFILIVVVNIFLNILLIPYLGNMGAAISTLIAFSIAAIYGIIIIKSMNLELMWKFLLKSVIASSVMGAAIIFLMNFLVLNEILKIIIIILSSSLIYFLTLFLLKSFDKEEFQFFTNLLKFKKIGD